MNRCSICNEGTFQEQLVGTWRRRGGRWVLFENVPALVCDLCGEKAFPQKSAERLASILDVDSREFPTSFFWAPVFDLAKIDLARAQGQRAIMASGTEDFTLALPTPPPVPLHVTEETNAAGIYSAYP